MFWLWRPGSKEHGHAVVKSPSGHYVDVFGPGALGRWKISCFGEEFSVVPRSADDFAYAKLNLEATLPFAEAVLNRYFGSSDNPDSEFEVEESVWGWE